MTAPDMSAIEPDPGCTLVEMPFGTKGSASFIDGDPDGDRIRMRMFVRESDCRLIAKVWFGPMAEGPPLHAHGGSKAAVLDHVMGAAAWVAGHPVVAANISIDFIKKLPLGHLTTVEAWVEKAEGKKVTTAGRIYIENFEEPYTAGTGLFILQSLEDFRGILGDADLMRERLDRFRAT